MVRLEINSHKEMRMKNIEIYIPVWLDQKFSKLPFSLLDNIYLHSSMVRLEIELIPSYIERAEAFTFQYGQIRNQICAICFNYKNGIYIPVWLDQKFVFLQTQKFF